MVEHNFRNLNDKLLIFPSTSTKYKLIACKHADLQGFCNYFYKYFHLLYHYKPSTNPLQTHYKTPTKLLPTHQALAVDTTLKITMLIRIPRSRKRDGTFESFRWHLRVVPMVPSSRSDSTLGGIPMLGILCSTLWNILFHPMEHFTPSVGMR